MKLKEVKMQNVLALIVIILCFGYFYYISSARFPINLLKDISDLKIAMITMVTAIISYYFGSSKSKQEAQVQIENYNPTKPKKMITGYYIDLPTGSNSIGVNGEEEVPLSTYTAGMVTAETDTHYGLVEWDNSTAIVSAMVNGNPVEVQTLIGGHHPVARPK